MLKPERIDKLYFYIGEVAIATGVTPSAIRFYEEQFFIDIKKRNAKGERLFSKNDLKKFEWIVRACSIYKLQTVKIALLTFPERRFLRQELLTNEEQQQILDYAKTKLGAIGRSRIDTSGSTGDNDRLGSH